MLSVSHLYHTYHTEPDNDVRHENLFAKAGAAELLNVIPSNHSVRFTRVIRHTPETGVGRAGGGDWGG